MTAAAAFPPLADSPSATPLSLLCACLTPETAADPQLAEEIKGGAIPWPELLWLAGLHRVTPALAASLRRKALFEFLPGEIREYLDTLRELNHERNRLFYQELTHIAQRLNRLGVEPMLLKGAIALLPGEYPGAEDRVLGDLDLLLPDAAIDEASEVVRSMGYQEGIYELITAKEASLHHHAPRLMHPELPVAVELHKRLLYDRRDDAQLCSRLIGQRIVLPGTDVAVRIPDPQTRLLHNFLHTQIQDLNHALFSLEHRQLLEFVLLRHWRDGQWDWPELAKRLRPKRQRAFAVYLLAAERWYDQAMPPDLHIPVGSKFCLDLTERAQAESRWRRLLALYRIPRKYLPRLSGLPRKLLRPSWPLLKYQSLRRGEPL